MSELTGDQRLAVEHTGGPLIVLAGPGTGKTRVITHRIARLIGEGVRPDTIAAMTYTVKAAGEMRERIASLTGAGSAEGLFAGTMHALGARLLARFGDMIGVRGAPVLMDSAQRRSLLESAALRAHGEGRIDPGRVAQLGIEGIAERAWAWINRLRTRAVFASEAAGLAERWLELVEDPPAGWEGVRVEAERARRAELAEASVLYVAFESECALQGLVTFDDYVLLPLRLLRSSREARAIVHAEMRHVVVDELQDLNPAQLSLLRELAPPEREPDLCVVGDDDQAIYGFRGADPRAFHRVRGTWRGATEIVLRSNYRSSGAVLSASGVIIGKATERFAPEKTLEARRVFEDEPGPVEVVHLEKEDHGGAVIAALIRGEHAASGRPLESYAVIASTHAELERVGGALELAGVAVCRSRAREALDDEAVKDLVEWMRLLVEGDAYSAVRLLTRPPLGMVREEAAALSRSFDRTRRRAEAEGAAGPGFMEWLAGLDAPASAAARLVAMHRSLVESVAMAPAADAVRRIVEVTGLAHAELLTGPARAARVSAVVSVLRFVLRTGPRLEAPGDLGAFWRHYQRLDERERGFGGERSLDRDEDEAFDGPGVRLLTAHGAKGLEFDTVFIPRIGAMKGCFGSVEPSPDVERLPEELTGEAPVSRRDEVRRLFYVAMTRAERRLVLLSRRAQKRSSSMHFVHELAWPETRPPAAGLVRPGVLVRDEAEVLSWAAGLGVPVGLSVDPLLVEGGGSGRSGVLSGARRGAMQRASDALASVSDAGAGEAALSRAVAGLRDAAEALAALARVEAGVELPSWLERQRELTEMLGALAGAGERGSGGSLAPRAPLDLSYTTIRQYIDCPACYWLKHVLGLPEPPSEHLVVGSVVHRALERYFGRVRDADAGEGPMPGRAELIAMGREAYFAPARGIGSGEAQQLARIEALLVTAAERLHEPGAEILMLEDAFSMAYARGDGSDAVPHTIRGKLDRVDRLAGGGFRVIDYKTGRARKHLLKPPADDLQMGLYALALADMFGVSPEELEGEAAYWLLSSGEAGTISFGTMDLDAVRASVDGAIAGILSGAFEPGQGCRGACVSLLGAG